MKALLRFLIPFLLGVAVGSGGYFAWLNYWPAEEPMEETMMISSGPSVLETLPYGMVVEKTSFAKRPVFCIEQPELKTEIEQVCKVLPGFYATFVKNLLNSVEWKVAEGARFQNDWRKAGLGTNQSGAEFMPVARRLGAVKLRFEERGDKQMRLTHDVGGMSYRLWLEASGAPAKAKPKPKPKPAKEVDDDEEAPKLADLGIPAHFKLSRVATILSFD